MSWKNILHDEIRKDWEFNWNNVDSEFDFKNVPDGYEERPSNDDSHLTKVSGSSIFDVRTWGMKMALSSVNEVSLFLDVRFLHEDGKQFKDLFDNFEQEVNSDSGNWTKNEVNPDSISFTIDMNKSFDRSDWKWDIFVSWGGMY